VVPELGGEVNFPKATLILDFYHAGEHLATVARLLIVDVNERKQWFEAQKALLLDSQLPSVPKAIRQLRPTTAEQVDEKQKLIRYYLQNEQRMDYKWYKEQGWHIGPGAIEAAHRTVVQDRMKKSGQRWSNAGAQNMPSLRVCSRSDRWHLVVDKIKMAA
jgi:succinate dehydrogenase/fumarate reductase-like Fe-S protein